MLPISVRPSLRLGATHLGLQIGQDTPVGAIDAYTLSDQSQADRHVRQWGEQWDIKSLLHQARTQQR